MKHFPLKIFHSYSHADESYRMKLQKHLSVLERQGQIAHWHDRKIIPGTEWSGEISSRLASADIVLLYISPDFLASDYCYEYEMKNAIKHYENNNVRVVPIITRRCDWKSTPVSKFQGLPTDAEPIESRYWHSDDDAYHLIVDGLKNLIEEIMDSSELHDSIRIEQIEYSAAFGSRASDFGERTFQNFEIDYKELRYAVLVLRAVNHKLRQRMIGLFKEKGTLTVSDICSLTRIEQSVASQHLAILRRADVVQTKRTGMYINYNLNANRMSVINQAVKLLQA